MLDFSVPETVFSSTEAMTMEISDNTSVLSPVLTAIEENNEKDYKYINIEEIEQTNVMNNNNNDEVETAIETESMIGENEAIEVVTEN